MKRLVREAIHNFWAKLDIVVTNAGIRIGIGDGYFLERME